MRRRPTRIHLIIAVAIALLLAAAVSYKLLSGRKDSNAAESEVPQVAILSAGTGAAGGDALKGISVGFEGHDVEFSIEDAGNDPALARTLAQALLADSPDVFIALGATAARVAADVNAGCPLVVAELSDPFSLGLASSDVEHREDVTGVYSSEPVEAAISLVRELYPAIIKIATIYNPADAESVAYLGRIRGAAADQALELVEIPLPALPLLDAAGRPLSIAAQDEALVQQAMQAIPLDVQLIFLPRDHQVLSLLEGLTKQAALRNLPVVTNETASINGCLAALGDEYVSVGREAAHQALSILAGTSPADIPLLSLNTVILALNREVAQKLLYVFPASVEQRATRTSGTPGSTQNP